MLFDPLAAVGDDEGVFDIQSASDEEPSASLGEAAEAEPVVPVYSEPSPVAAAAPYDPSSISVSQLLEDRPDVLRAFYETYYGSGNDRNSGAWAHRVGGATPEAYAKYWYEHQGKFEGYNQGPTTAGDNVSVERILHDRPDVLRAFYKEYYGPDNDRHSDAWEKRVGGDTPEAYAKYWYEHHGKWEGYAQTDKAAAENADVERLLHERPDVFRAFYTEYYGAHNDRHSSAWVDRVGGDTIQDYAKYWYAKYGQAEGYTQRPPSESAPPETAPENAPVFDDATEPPPVTDPSLDPWNHPAIYPGWTPPYPGWQPPDAGGVGKMAASGAPVDPPSPPGDELLMSVGRSLYEPDLLG